jgi:predicted DNA-binding transcriptional regulator AlpA
MEVLSVRQAADYIGLSESFLNKRRVYGGGPLYIKVGRRVVYDREHLDSWMSDRTIGNTSQILAEAS